MSKAGKILDAFLADEFHGMNGMAEGDVERSQILHLIEYVLKRNVTDSKTIDERVDEIVNCAEDYFEGRIDATHDGLCENIRRHLIAHEEQVRQEERAMYTRKAAHCISMGSSAARVATAVVFVKMLADGDERWREAKGGDDHGEL